MANRYFNKQTTNARQALAQGGPAGTGKGAAPFKDPRTTGRPKGRPGPMGPGPKRPRRPSLQDLPKGGPKRKLKPFDNTDKTPKPKTFDNTDKTDREKITRDRIKRNEIKDKLDKLKKRFSTNKTKVAVNKTQKGGSKRTKSMMDSTRAKSLGLK